MSELSERHEVRVQGEGQTIVFIADSQDGRLIIRQEPEGKKSNDVCAIALSNPDELRAFFNGLRRILASLGHRIDGPAETRGGRAIAARPGAPGRDSEEREALVAQARQRNPQAFAPWTRNEEEEIRRRHADGESVQTIAQARRRSPRAIELRLQRLGVLPPDEQK
jgi:hypothetical protein